MTARQKAKAIIQQLLSGNLYVDCPSCEKRIPLKSTNLFYLDDFPPEAEETYKRKLEQIKEYKKELKAKRVSIPKVSEVGARAVNIGSILERLAPSMKSFQFDKNDCRSLFDPIDYVIFEGLNKGGKVKKIIFIDIKTGNSRLTPRQRNIRDLVEGKSVAWDTYGIGGEQ
jgi:predicted Holliday junction resolvase-like endonuclease